MRDSGVRMNLWVLQGPNFSGRTQRLREWVGLPSEIATDPVYSQTAYIGPAGAANLSGMAPSVAAEIELMAADGDAGRSAKRALEDLGFGYCLGQNPFTLSGGEQVVVALLAALAGRPKRLAIDCAFEQLSPVTRASVMQYLSGMDVEVMVADNRLDEWHRGPTDRLDAVSGAPVMKPDDRFSVACEPCEIELVDLCHSYVKGRTVLNKLNMKFEAGAQYLLSGPNGVGKTTLSKILCGLLRPTSGQIRLNGQPVEPWRQPGAFVSYAFQDPDLQLFANDVSGQLASAKKPEAVARWFGLDQHLSEHPLDLPFVLKKRLAIGSALGREKSLSILDEPTIGQDSRSVAASQGFLSGATMIVISHSTIYSNVQRIELRLQGDQNAKPTQANQA
jgi:energy-coupling factor transporter ATP-binding protein EcfA2